MLQCDQMDAYMVCGDKDIRLLRHFLTSYDLFFESKGKIYLWVWRHHEYLLQDIALPENLILLFKDDVPELIDDDYKNQMYLKLIAHRYVETEWYWLPDTDYVIVSPLCKADFFKGDKPYWFYCNWHDVSEEMFRKGSEAFLGEPIGSQFLAELQFVHNKKISSEFSAKHDPKNILTKKYLAAEQVVYGAFAYKKFPNMYEWADEAIYDGPVVSYKVNQQPPSYCVLDDEVKLRDLPEAKYHVFWSHWEKAEEKMIEFLMDAQLRAFGKIKIQPNGTKLFRYWDPEEIDRGSLGGIDGIYSDGWLMSEVWFCIPADDRSVLSLELVVPNSPSGNDAPLYLSIKSNGKHQTVLLDKGLQVVKVKLDNHAENRVTFAFEGGFPEPGGERILFSQLREIQLEKVG